MFAFPLVVRRPIWVLLGIKLRTRHLANGQDKGPKGSEVSIQEWLEQIGKRATCFFGFSEMPRQGKYEGRAVADLLLPDGHDLANTLIAAGHGRPCVGGRRGSWRKEI